MNNNQALTITEAVAAWRNDTSEDKKDFLNQVMRRHYVPFGEKIRLARLAQDVAHTVRNDKGDVLGYEMDGLQTYFQNVIAVIDSYTNIDIGNGDTMQNYDALQEHGIVRLILANIGDDLTEWTRVWNLTSEDFYQKHFTTRGWLENAWQKIVGGLARLRENTINAFTEALEENPDLGDMLKGIGVDAEKLLQKKENEDVVEQGEKS